MDFQVEDPHLTNNYNKLVGFPGGSDGKESAYSSGDLGSIPGLGSSPGEGIQLTTPVFLDLPSGSDGQESTCYVGDLGLIPEWEDPMEKDMVTHSSVLAWRIPWSEKPGGQQSIGLQRVEHG